MLFIQGHITMAHTLQAVWFLKGPLHIESNQVKQSQHNLMGNVVHPDRQKGVVIILEHQRVFCMTTKHIQSLNPNWLNMQTNVITDLNIKTDEIDNEMVFTGVILEERRLEFSASFWFFVLLDGVAVLLCSDPNPNPL